MDLKNCSLIGDLDFSAITLGKVVKAKQDRVRQLSGRDLGHATAPQEFHVTVLIDQVPTFV